jgi:Ca-activated chloride channel family protein
MSSTPHPQISLTTDRPVAGVNQKYIDVLLRVTGPSLPRDLAKTRKPVNLALVIDASGSMQGHPLKSAKLAAERMIQSMRDDDRVSVIAYGSTVQTIIESTEVRAVRHRTSQLISRIGDLGNTALHAGWLEGAHQIAPYVGAYGVSRINLLSDGQANSGVTNVQQIVDEAVRLHEAGISTSTYGIGNGFNEDLMSRMAIGGSAFYAQDAGGLEGYFATEFDVLSSLVGRRLLMHVKATRADGSEISWYGLNNDHTFVNDGKHPGMMAIQLPDLVADAEVWYSFRVDLPGDVGVGEVIEIAATVDWNDLDGNAQPTLEARSSVKVIASDQVPQERDEIVVERAKEAEAARIQIEMIAAARRGDMAQAESMIMGLSAMAADNAYVAAVADDLTQTFRSGDRAAFMKSATYSAKAMSTRRVDMGEDYKSLSVDRFNLRKASSGMSVRDGFDTKK